MQKIILSNDQKAKLNAILNRHASYAKFSANQKDAYEYTATLGVRVCPYCNINYTYTVYERPNDDGSPGPYSSPACRPDMDHFELKSVVTGLSLAQQNLIPACQQCNSRVKLRQVFNPSTHIHPFQDDFDSIKRFTINLGGPDYLDRKSFSIGFANRSSNAGDLTRADKSIEDLRLLARYQYHKEDVVDLLKKANYYHQQRLREIGDLVGKELVGVAELRRHLFLSEMKPINESPLSKLRRDTLNIILR
jgi:hypothetical protein